MVQPIRSPENSGTTVVSIGHLTPWPENPGYRTQVWDDTIDLIVFQRTQLNRITSQNSRGHRPVSLYYLCLLSSESFMNLLLTKQEMQNKYHYIVT